MDLRESRELKQQRRGANERGGWHRVLFLMMVAIALAGIVDAQKPSGKTPVATSAVK